MEAVEAGGHKEGRAIDVVGEGKTGMGVFKSLQASEQDAKDHGEKQAKHETAPVVFKQRMMRPSHRCAGGEQDQRVDEGHAPWIEGVGKPAKPGHVGVGAWNRRPLPAEYRSAGI